MYHTLRTYREQKFNIASKAREKTWPVDIVLFLQILILILSDNIIFQSRDKSIPPFYVLS